MGSYQTPIGVRSSSMVEASCGFLLQELQKIWDEVGEDKFEREKILLDLEQECLEVFRRKVDRANICRARLHQELVEAEAEYTHLLLTLGERSFPEWQEKRVGTLKEQLKSISPALQEMYLRKEERLNQFRAVQGEIQKVKAEIAGNNEDAPSSIELNESDLSLKKLEEYKSELQLLYNEKNERLKKVDKYIEVIYNLSNILGKESSAIISKVHPSLSGLKGKSKNTSDSILIKLNSTVESLKEEKQNRLDKIHHLGKALTDLWNLMDTPNDDRLPFSHITGLLSISSLKALDPGILSLEIIQKGEAEVKRLNQLKASKMKEIFMKKQEELGLICKKSHMEIASQSEMNSIFNLMNTGEIEHSDLLEKMDEQISKAKEEAASRKAIMEKVEKWILACDEERWLEEYNRDENRYSVSRGAHKNLRRAERARITVSKIPALVEMLMAMTKNWEEERNKVFLYDQAPLLAILEDYHMVRQEKEEEKKKQQGKKKVQSQLEVQQDSIYSSRTGTSSKRFQFKTINGGIDYTATMNRRHALGIQQLE